MPAITATGRVGAVRAGRDQADVAVVVAVGAVVVADREQAGELALRAGVGLQRHRVVAGDLGQPALQVVEQLQVAGELVGRRERVHVGEAGQVIGSISVVALSFIVQEPSGIMPRSSAKSRSARRRR